MAIKSVFDDFDAMTSEQMAARLAFTGLTSDDDRRAFATWIKSCGWLHEPTGKSVTEQMAEKQGTATCMACGATNWRWDHKCPPGAAEAYRKSVMDANESHLPLRDRQYEAILTAVIAYGARCWDKALVYADKSDETGALRKKVDLDASEAYVKVCDAVGAALRTEQSNGGLPRLSGQDGWTLDFKFLAEIRHEIQNRYDEDAFEEVIEAVLLAAESKLQAPKQAEGDLCRMQHPARASILQCQKAKGHSGLHEAYIHGIDCAMVDWR